MLLNKILNPYDMKTIVSRAKEADDSHYHKHGLGVATSDTDEYSSYLSAGAWRLNHEYSTRDWSPSRTDKHSIENQPKSLRLYWAAGIHPIVHKCSIF